MDLEGVPLDSWFYGRLSRGAHFEFEILIDAVRLDATRLPFLA
jgi:hypothetical protein